MRFIWEEEDIQPGWRVISTGNTECIIGYRYDNQNKGEQRLTLISLDDGLLIVEFGLRPGLTGELTARSQMADFLNDGSYKPLTLTRFS